MKRTCSVATSVIYISPEAPLPLLYAEGLNPRLKLFPTAGGAYIAFYVCAPILTCLSALTAFYLTPTRPGQVTRLGNQAALHRIIAQAPEFFQAPLLAPCIRVVVESAVAVHPLPTGEGHNLAGWRHVQLDLVRAICNASTTKDYSFPVERSLWLTRTCTSLWGAWSAREN